MLQLVTMIFINSGHLYGNAHTFTSTLRVQSTLGKPTYAFTRIEKVPFSLIKSNYIFCLSTSSIVPPSLLLVASDTKSHKPIHILRSPDTTTNYTQRAIHTLMTRTWSAICASRATHDLLKVFVTRIPLVPIKHQLLQTVSKFDKPLLFRNGSVLFVSVGVYFRKRPHDLDNGESFRADEEVRPDEEEKERQVEYPANPGRQSPTVYTAAAVDVRGPILDGECNAQVTTIPRAADEAFYAVLEMQFVHSCHRARETKYFERGMSGAVAMAPLRQRRLRSTDFEVLFVSRSSTFHNGAAVRLDSVFDSAQIYPSSTLIVVAGKVLENVRCHVQRDPKVRNLFRLFFVVPHVCLAVRTDNVDLGTWWKSGEGFDFSFQIVWVAVTATVHHIGYTFHNIDRCA
jgi:hypothetical protein